MHGVVMEDLTEEMRVNLLCGGWTGIRCREEYSELKPEAGHDIRIASGKTKAWLKGKE